MLSGRRRKNENETVDIWKKRQSGIPVHLPLSGFGHRVEQADWNGDRVLIYCNEFHVLGCITMHEKERNKGNYFGNYN